MTIVYLKDALVRDGNDADALECCADQAGVLMNQWGIQSKGCDERALTAIQEAQNGLEAIVETLRLAARRERIPEWPVWKDGE